METLGLLARRPKQAASPDHFPSTTAENTPPHPKYSSFTASAKQRAQNNLHSKYSSPPQRINIAQNIVLQIGHAMLKAWFLLETTARASSPPWPSTKAHIFLEHKILFFFSQNILFYLEHTPEHKIFFPKYSLFKIFFSQAREHKIFLPKNILYSTYSFFPQPSTAQNTLYI